MTCPKVSILIANYNNAKYIAECINSLKKQTYKNIEIIFFDDFSQDTSIKEIKSFKNIKLIQNIKKTSIGSFNQMKAYEEAFKLSEGEIILFLDSDDYYHETKIQEVVNYFNKHREAKIVFDYPLIKNNSKISFIKKKKKKFFKQWPYIHPTSCISLRRENFQNIYKAITLKEYPDVWIDFRICLYAKYVLNDFHIIEKNLTYYRQIETSISSKFKHLSKNWWKRRMEAHNYLIFLVKKENINFKKNIDFYITKLINFFIK